MNAASPKTDTTETNKHLSTEHATRAVKMCEYSKGLRNGAFARAIFAMYLAFCEDTVDAAIYKPLIVDGDNVKKEVKTAALNRMLDRVFGFDHTTDDSKKIAKAAPLAVRQMVSYNLPAAIYFYEQVRADPANTPKLDIARAGAINEKAELFLPGPWFYDTAEEAGASAWTRGVAIDGTGTGKKARTVERVNAIAAHRLGRKSKGATASDNPMKKAWEDIPLGVRTQMLADELRTKMVDKPDTFKAPEVSEPLSLLNGVLGNMKARVVDGEMADLLLEADDMIETVRNLALQKGNKPLLRKLMTLYDALEEASKDTVVWQAMQDAVVAEPAAA